MDSNSRSSNSGKIPAGPQSSGGEGRTEVDYYLNPTELFRWINYRRWDGAKARVLSHPEECSTWIVSRHSSDGRILWRHLPLHLVCMQVHTEEDEDINSRQKSIEELIDVLLEAYPEGAQEADDQGMLPLHLLVANSAQPNDRIIGALILAFPSATEVLDKYGRTPMDLLREKASDGPAREAAIRAFARAKRTMDMLGRRVEDKHVSKLRDIESTSQNERMASQRIIMRLEQELEETRKAAKQMELHRRSRDDSTAKLERTIQNLQDDLEQQKQITQSVKRERDELLLRTEMLESQAQETEQNHHQVKEQMEGLQQEHADTVASMKSEVSTAKAMAAALESQMRSRFTNEEYLTNTVADLETKLADRQVEYERELKKLQNERDALEDENTTLGRNNEDLEKRITSLQNKLNEVNKQLSNILTSHGALNAEHDRMLDSSMRLEADMVERNRNERSMLMGLIKKQWDFLESTMKNQEQLMEEFQKKEMGILELSKEERDRSVEVITRIREEFRDTRSSALERQRQMQEEHISGVTPAVKVQSANKSIRSNMSRSERSTSSSQRTTRTSAASMLAAEASTVASAASNKSYRQPHRDVSSYGTKSRIVDQSSSFGESHQKMANSSRQQASHEDRNLLEMLEARAEQASTTRISSGSRGDSSTFASSGNHHSRMSSSMRRGAAHAPSRPHLIHAAPSGRTSNFDSESTSSSASPSTRSGRKFSSHQSPPTRPGPSLSLDDYSNNSGAASTSGSEDSSEDERHANDTGRGKSRYSGMIHGLRKGMIRIVEEGSEADSQK